MKSIVINEENLKELEIRMNWLEKQSIKWDDRLYEAYTAKDMERVEKCKISRKHYDDKLCGIKNALNILGIEWNVDYDDDCNAVYSVL